MSIGMYQVHFVKQDNQVSEANYRSGERVALVLQNSQILGLQVQP